MTAQDRQFRDGDVFRFRYNKAERERASLGWGGSLDHCFDGQLVYRGGMLIDSYWGIKDVYPDGRRFRSVDEARSKGTLTFVCNLHDVETIPDYDFPMYADSDAFNLSYQQGCYKLFVKHKGAKKNPAKMLAAINAKFNDLAYKLDWAQRDFDRFKERMIELRAKIEAGEEVSL